MKMGINAIATYLLPSDVDFVNQCYRWDIDVFAERAKKDSDLEKLSRVMELCGDKITGIISYDDVDGDFGYPAENVKRMNEEIKRRWPEHLRYISGGYPSRIHRYKNCGQDKVLFQAYPIGNGEETVSDAGLVYFRSVADAFPPEHWAPVIQAFAWPGGRHPTRSEIRSMTYQALSYGAGEVWFYTFYDSNNDMSKKIKYCHGLRRLNRELNLAGDFWTRRI